MKNDYIFGLDPYKDSTESKGSFGWSLPPLPKYQNKDYFYEGDVLALGEDLDKLKRGDVSAIHDKNTFIKTRTGLETLEGVIVDIDGEVLFGKLYSLILKE